MDKRIYPGLLIALAFIVVGMVFWSQHKEATSHTLPVNSAKRIVDQQIQDIQNSKYLTPQQKDDQIARVRAFNRNLGTNNTRGPGH